MPHDAPDLAIDDALGDPTTPTPPVESAVSRVGLRERLGLPDVGRHRRFVTAIAIDATGSGVYMPLAVLYFARTTSLPVEQVGLAMSLQAAIAFPFVLLVGHLVDRVGAKRLLLVGNVAQAVGFASFPLAHSFWPVLGALTVVGLGQAMFWGSYSPMVAAISGEGERELWFGFLGALRNVGFAVGGLGAGAAVALGTVAAFHAAVLLNAASYVVALALLAGVAAHETAPADAEARAEHGGWGRVLRDRDYGVLVLASLMYALASMALNVAMPVYTAELLGLPGWVVGAVFVVNTILVGFAQSPLVRTMTGHRRWRIGMAAQGLFAVGYLGMIGAGLLPTALAVPAVLAAVAVYTLGEIYGGPVLAAIAVESPPEALRGRYMSLYQLSWTASGVVAPAAYTWLMAHGRFSVWWSLLGVSAVGAALGPVLARRLPVAAAPVTNAAA